MAADSRRRCLFEGLRGLAARPGGEGRYRQQAAGASAPSGFVAPPPAPAVRLAGATAPSGPLRRVLGISAFYHDSAAALVVAGVPVAAAQEERFSRRKFDPALPRQAVDYCLAEAGLTFADIDLVAFYEEPLLKLDRLLQSAIAAGRGYEDLVGCGWFDAVERNLALSAGLGPALGYEGPVAFVQHHLSHAASAFYSSPFAEAACLVCDGVGEWATTTLARCDAQGIEVLEQIEYPHSLGLLYSAVTAHLGFAANSDEYKVMALAAFGAPSFRAELERIFARPGDGSFRLALDPLAPALRRRDGGMDQLTAQLGVAARCGGGPLGREHEDLARTLQEATEEVMTALLGRLRRRTGLDHLVLAGGVALNGVANHRAFAASGFRNLFIQPAAGDAGGALGAALYAYHLGQQPRPAHAPRARFPARLGPAFGREEVARCLRQEGARFRTVAPEELPALTARALADGRVVGWFQGRMEFGPRALGGRSILASPVDPAMKDTLNLKVKLREGFRPFAPILPEEEATRYFELPVLYEPLYYMLFVLPVRGEQRARIPASLHVDGTTRPQLVTRDENPLLHGLLRAFEQESGVPVLLNTSFNLAGEPIVCTPSDAYQTFRYSGLDLLVMEDCVVERAG
jgi:carbamoyltransferase